MMTTSKIIKDKNKFKYESKIEDNLKKGADPEKEDYLKKWRRHQFFIQNHNTIAVGRHPNPT